ncbi:MAG: phosphoglucomutase [Salinivirgaceae bacterium]|nr:MAG: phosphoglucomutase [Salinivirgaceae bacterium]
MSKDTLQIVKEKAQQWLAMDIDQDTRTEIEQMLKEEGDSLVDAFYQNLEFGTGGLRGIMGAGSNRMNIYTVGMATQGLANYLKMNFKNQEISVAIAHDCRNNGELFAQTTADIFSANGIKVYLFDALRPTPELSFAIRELGCKSGVVVTASHNPKEYNGYKVYWEDGAQIIAPHDKNIINEVAKVDDISKINFNKNEALIEIIGAELDDKYIAAVKTLSLSPEVIDRNKDMKIVFTPIHGTAVKLVPMALKAFGFENVIHIPEQDITDGNFPTVKSPNPEEPAALQMAINRAKEIDADLVMATDPDADRVGIAVKNLKGEFALLNGNQAATLLINYLLTKWKENGKLDGKQYIVKTIVTTELLPKIAAKYSVDSHDVLTGFKFIADIIGKKEGKETFIGGGEESYGYLAGEFVRDKDAVMSCALIAEAVAWANDQGKSAFEMLMDIYIEYGLFYESLISIVKKGKAGADEIKAMMENLRSNPPKELAGNKVVRIIDYQSGEDKNMLSGDVKPTGLPKSNVLQFITEDGSKISARPSGTEPKIKFYFGVTGELKSHDQFDEAVEVLKAKIEKIKAELV